jgi:hypothetical protein
MPRQKTYLRRFLAFASNSVILDKPTTEITKEAYMYSILRAAKVKSRNEITKAAEHNLRLRTQRNIDSTKTKLNQVLLNSLGVDLKNASDLQKK